ncbi:hypothetical protein C8J56DRAFT_1112444 [Mycena floridula]|nr:hypothetical protein C8J56DRAFT_1112444 [Mycena floridula]
MTALNDIGPPLRNPSLSRTCTSVGSGRARPGIDRAGQGSIGQGIIRINARALGPDGRQGRAGQGQGPGLYWRKDANDSGDHVILYSIGAESPGQCPGLRLFRINARALSPPLPDDEGRAFEGRAGQGKGGHQGRCPARPNTNLHEHIIAIFTALTHDHEVLEIMVFQPSLLDIMTRIWVVKAESPIQTVPNKSANGILASAVVIHPKTVPFSRSVFPAENDFASLLYQITPMADALT